MATKHRRPIDETARGVFPHFGWAWIATALRVATALAIVAFAVAAYLQWQSLRAIERLLTATQRPWISASVEPVTLAFDDQGGQLTLKTTLRNYGPVPAVDILAATIFLLKDPQRSYRNACAEHGIGGGLGPTLAKDENYAATTTAWLPRSDFGKTFPSLVALCIKYRYATGPKTGDAGYLFSISRRDPPRPDLYFVESKNGAFNPPQLVLTPVASYQD